MEEKICPLMSIALGRLEKCLGADCVFFIESEMPGEESCALVDGLLALRDLGDIMEDLLTREEMGEWEEG